MVQETAVIVVLLGTIVAVIAVTQYYRTERAKTVAAGGGEYRALAEQALQTQKALLQEVQRMNTHLREIERLLKEV